MSHENQATFSQPLPCVISFTMKLLKKQINEKDGAGLVVLRAEEPEDMWHIYNLIHVMDLVKTTTIRKARNTSISFVRPNRT